MADFYRRFAYVLPIAKIVLEERKYTQENKFASDIVNHPRLQTVLGTMAI